MVETKARPGGTLMPKAFAVVLTLARWESRARTTAKAKHEAWHWHQHRFKSHATSQLVIVEVRAKG